MSDGLRICGVKDQLGTGGVCRWPTGKLTWTITAELPGLSLEMLHAAYAEAWGYWAEVCDLEPVYVTNARTANVLMGARRIDRAMGVLAESELPCGNAPQLQQWYDLSEVWTLSERPGPGQIDLVRVAAHEIGHVIGIPHIAGGNLLQPTYDLRIRRPQAGDIREAVRRYGPRRAPTPPPAPQPPIGGNDVDREALKARLQFLVGVLAGVTRLTPTTVDDQLVAMLTPMVSEDWFLDLLLFLLSRTGGRAPTPQEFAAAVAQFRSA